MYISDLSNFLFKSHEGNNIVMMLNDVFGKLIENDQSLSPENTASPQIWEQRWFNDDNIAGYSKGDAVWLNTQSYDNIVRERYTDISSYVENHPGLSRRFRQIDVEDKNEVFKFFKSVANGTVNSDISAIYWLGQISDAVQIMVSLENNNKDAPNNLSSWKPFLSSVTYDTVHDLISSNLVSTIVSSMQNHNDVYHISAFPAKLAESFIQQNTISAPEPYYFYDFEYSNDLSGFDYVIDYRFDKNNNRWYRRWNSGYLEVGGYTVQTTDPLINVQFLHSFNYPLNYTSYPPGYDSFKNASITGGLPSTRRYCVHVTPVKLQSSASGFPPVFTGDVDSRSYAIADITNISNTGFSIINSDPTASVFQGYYYTASGFIMNV